MTDLNMWPDREDSLVRHDEDPPGWHIRETTGDGYPLMGSSPAERAEGDERVASAKRQATRDHPFEGEGRYCQVRIGWAPVGSAETGVITGWSACGYPRDTHPEDD